MPLASSEYVDTVIVGTGPAALILSYILHGNIPHYCSASRRHPDSILHSRLRPNVFDVDVKGLAAHFCASRFSYSTSALPVNVLLDTLLRPLADTEPDAYESCIEWRHRSECAVPHVLLGDAPPGGQWASNLIPASQEIEALSYLDQLSLPGYSFRDYFRDIGISHDQGFLRPTRKQVADYLSTYPFKANIDDSLRPLAVVSGVRRISEGAEGEEGFLIASHNLRCKHLVLASGVFCHVTTPRPSLRPLVEMPEAADSSLPILIVGSGFTAADLIITNIKKRKIIHIFKWDPENYPSPLRSCHKQAYPDYAGVYRRMKRAVAANLGEGALFSPPIKKRSEQFFVDAEDSAEWYEGFPNTFIQDVGITERCGRVRLKLSDGTLVTREVSKLHYVIGRLGSLEYLDRSLLDEVLGQDQQDPGNITRHTLRAKVEQSLEVAPDVFAVGSLAGDSLIRHAYGTCVFAAKSLIRRWSEPVALERESKAPCNEPCTNQNSSFRKRLGSGVDPTHCTDAKGPRNATMRQMDWWNGASCSIQ